jgi:trimethylamine--corrinoid protein Co-methyltransferase
MEQIHEASVRLVGQVGFKVANQRLVARLSTLGASVEGDVVKYPAGMVQWAVEAVPRSLTLYGRAGQVLRMGGDSAEKHAGPHANAVKFLDYQATRLRDSTLQDLANAARVADALPDCTRTGCPCYPWDMPPRWRELKSVEAMLLNSTGHLTECPQTVREVELWFEALSLLYGDLSERPVLTVGISPQSPLALSEESGEMILFCTERGLPVMCAPCPMAGGTSPYTVAGTILQQNAESLAMITTIQLLQEGHPIIYGGAAGPLDLRTGSLSYGAQERNLMLGATMDLGAWYGFPRYSPAGSVDSPWPDVQMGLEKMAAMLTRLLSPAQMWANFGSVFNGLAISLEQMVIDQEIATFCRRLAGGIVVNEDTLAVEAVLRVGHAGQFLADEHTLRFMRHEAENVLPELSNRAGDAGQPMLEAAHEKVERILAEHQPAIPSEDADQIRQWAEEKQRE